MTSSEYNDNRPQDGQDEREQRRAQQEAYDWQTVERFIDLAARFLHYDFVEPLNAGQVGKIVGVMSKHMAALHEKEGF